MLVYNLSPYSLYGLFLSAILHLLIIFLTFRDALNAELV